MSTTLPLSNDANEWMTATDDRKDKKKISKLIKKANRGDIHTLSCYHTCLAAGIIAKPEIYITPGKSRESSQHDLNLNEIRELLLSLFSDSVPPRYFTIKNKAWIRTIVIVHIMDASPDCLKGLTSSRPVLVRVSRQDREWNLLPERLLTMDDEEAQLLLDKMHKNDGQVSTNNVHVDSAVETKHEEKAVFECEKTVDLPNPNQNKSVDSTVNGMLTKLEPYVMTEGALRIWGYPLPLPSPTATTMCTGDQATVASDTTTAAALSSSSSSVVRPLKRPRIDSSTVTDQRYIHNNDNNDLIGHDNDNEDDSLMMVGILTGTSQHLMPSNRFAQRLLRPGLGLGQGSNSYSSIASATSSSSSSSSLTLSRVQVQDGTTLLEDFVETLPMHSLAYQQLWSTSTSTISTRVVIDESSGGDVGSSEGGLGSTGRGVGSGEGGRGSCVRTPHPLVAVDCEMCDTQDGLVLTRLTLIDHASQVLLDTLVKPRLPITNYRTQWSGITEQLLENVTVTQEQAMVLFLRMVSQETVLCGHSLDSDLKALKVIHRRCVDTAVMYPHPRGFPLRLKLKTLAADYLHIHIQKHNSGSSSSGHDSVEDASTAMRLTLLKMERGPKFGLRGPAANRTPLVTLLRAMQGLGTGDVTGLGVDVQVSMVFSSPEIAHAMSHCMTNDTKCHIVAAQGGQTIVSNCMIQAASLVTSTAPSWSTSAALATSLSSSSSSSSSSLAVDELCQTLSSTTTSLLPSSTPPDPNPRQSQQTLCFLSLKHPHTISPPQPPSDNDSIALPPLHLSSSSQNKSQDQSNLIHPPAPAPPSPPATSTSPELSVLMDRIKFTISNNPQHQGKTLLIFTAQPSQQTITTFNKQKQACEHPQSTLRWSTEMEKRLHEAYAVCNLASVAMMTL